MFKREIKFLVLVIILIFDITAFSAIIADNDGSVFVTKIEFESFKRSFEKQLEDYNKNIDNRIDYAIDYYLAAMEQKPVAETVLANMHGTRTFVRNFALANTNRLGDYVEGLSGVMIEGCDNDSKYTNTSGYTKMRLLSFDTDTSATPKSVSKGTYKDVFMIIKNSTWDSRYVIPLNQMRSIPYSAWAGYYIHHGNPPTSFSYPTPGAFNIEKTRETWGAEDKPYTNSFAGSSMTVNAQAFFINMDETLNESVLKYLAGSNVSETNLYTVHINDTEKIGNASTTIPINKGWFRVRYGGSDYSKEGSGWNVSGRYNLKTYHHKYENTYKLSDFVIDALSAALSKPVKYYSGLPLFKASINGKAKFTLRLTNNGNQASKVAIKNEAFENVAFTEGMQIENDAEWSVNNSTTFPSSFNSGTDYKFEFDVVKDKVYFIKVLPSTNSYNTTVNIIGDIVTVPEQFE